MNKVLEDLQNNKEYLAGLNEALFPDYAEVCGLMGNVGYNKGDYVLFQQLISKNPSDERLVQTIKNDVEGLFFFEFFCLPLARVLKYTIMNNLPLLAKYKFPPKYNLYEPESICGVLRQLTKKGREQIINSYDIDYVYSEKLRQAIMEPNVEIMRELLESKEVDLMWLQQMLDVVKYEDDLLNIIIDNNNDFSKEEIDNINNDYVKSIMLVDVPDVNEILRIKTTEKASVTEVCVLYLKNYWVFCDLLDEKTRTIIDAYINKPCFEEVVSKCRAEFEEEEKERRNRDYSWLPEDFFNDSNPPDTKKGNHLIKIMDAVSHGWYSKDGPLSEEEKNGDGRKKFMTLINECARLNFIKDDNETKARMAYVLTGRNVGFDIDEEKPLVWNYEYKNYLFYLLKFLFKRAPHKIALSIIDGIGEYATTDPITGEVKKINHSGLAEKLEMKSFPAFVHSLYEFCPPSKTPKGEGKQITDRTKKSKKQENS